MGVAHLWELLMAAGKRVPIEHLGGKTLAVDASIWIVRADAVFGNLAMVIKSILYKIILLVKMGVRPVFVFDGTPPSIKRNCLDARRRRKLEMDDKEIKKIAQLELLRVLKGEPEKPVVRIKKLERIGSDEEDEQEEENSIVEVNLKGLEPTEGDLTKAELQSELLCEKYKIMRENYPYLFYKYT